MAQILQLNSTLSNVDPPPTASTTFADTSSIALRAVRSTIAAEFFTLYH
ncbi:hypothetical protein [Oscillatoria sp. HE19RPO]|nr:hypothetical protein [Oscillatoria sp. HE19RPO]